MTGWPRAFVPGASLVSHVQHCPLPPRCRGTFGCWTISILVPGSGPVSQDPRGDSKFVCPRWCFDDPRRCSGFLLRCRSAVGRFLGAPVRCFCAAGVVWQGQKLLLGGQRFVCSREAFLLPQGYAYVPQGGACVPWEYPWAL